MRGWVRAGKGKLCLWQEGSEELKIAEAEVLSIRAGLEVEIADAGTT